MQAPVRLSVLASVSLIAVPVAAQIPGGGSIATVTVSPTGGTSFGEMYVIDHTALTATPLMLSAALAAERPNCVTMLDNVTGYVGTNTLAGTGDVYGITVVGGMVVEQKLNTTATAGGNVAQIAVVGSELYFTTQVAGAGGMLQSVPAAGGPVTAELDTLSIPGVTGLANAVCAIGTDVYVATFDSGTTANTGSLIKYDTIGNVGSLVLTLPQGRFVSGSSTFNTGIVNMIEHPTRPGHLLLQGVYGDYLTIDPTTAMVVQHDFAGFIDPVSGTVATNLVNAFAWDAERGDFVVGSRDGFCDRMCDGHSAEKVVAGVGSGTAANENSVNGMAHLPSGIGATDASNGAGCPGGGGYTATDVGIGLPAAGNAGFRVGLFSGTGGDLAVLLIGAQDPRLPLDGLGMTGCVLRTDILFSIPAALAGSGNGAGKVSIPLPLPRGVRGTVFRQWAEVQATATNPRGIVVSNGRRMQIR